jgi:hypothetical protein
MADILIMVIHHIMIIILTMVDIMAVIMVAEAMEATVFTVIIMQVRPTEGHITDVLLTDQVLPEQETVVIVIFLVRENQDLIRLLPIQDLLLLLQIADQEKVVQAEANTPDLIMLVIPVVLFQPEGGALIVALAILIQPVDIAENLQLIQEDLILQVIVNPDLPMFHLTMGAPAVVLAKEEVAVAAVPIVLPGQVLNLLIPVRHQAALHL